MSEASKQQTPEEIIAEFEAVEDRLVLRDPRPAGSEPPPFVAYCEECGGGLYRKMKYCGFHYREALAGLLPSQIAQRKARAK
jgi:hypothetical protein